MMTMMNNPVTQMMQLLRAGKNPRAILNVLAQSDPQVNQIMQMMNGKTPEQLRQIANNMAAERGTTVEDVARQLGIQIPSSR